jgi:aspartate racemase
MSYPHKIKDRTAFLQGKHQENPAYIIYQLISQLTLLGANIIAIPCSTAHTALIMNIVVQQLTKHSVDVILVNMLEAVAEFIIQHFPTKKHIGLLATLGTYQNAVYETIFSQFGLATISPDNNVQQSIHQAIYNTDYGIKSTSSLNLNTAKVILNNACEHLENRGADIIVLGCTEIPLVLTKNDYANIPLIDPTDILARKLIRLADDTKLKPY